MCLAIPGKVISAEYEGSLRIGRVQFGGVMQPVSLDFVPEAQVGDYVLVHVGFAIALINADVYKRQSAECARPYMQSLLCGPLRMPWASRFLKTQLSCGTSLQERRMFKTTLFTFIIFMRWIG